MSGNLYDFDATNVAPQTAFEVLPAGSYSAMIVASEMTPTKDGNGEYLKLTLEIIEGVHTGRKLFDRLNLKNANQQAVDIARATLSAICHATGVMRPGDSAALHQLPMQITVRVVDRKDAPGEKSNEVRGYKPIGAPGLANGPTPADAAKPTPSWKKKG